MTYRECPICKEYGFFNDPTMLDHSCGDQYNVWDDDEADADSTEEFRLIYASSAEGAAEKAARRWSDDGPFSGTIYVREWNGSENAQGPTCAFGLEPRYELQFDITQK